MARSTTDDIREIMAYFRIQAQDRAHAQWKQKIAELQEKKARGEGGRGVGSMNVPQRAP